MYNKIARCAATGLIVAANIFPAFAGLNTGQKAQLQEQKEPAGDEGFLMVYTRPAEPAKKVLTGQPPSLYPKTGLPDAFVNGYREYEPAIRKAIADKRTPGLRIIRQHGNSPEALLAALFSKESGFDQSKRGKDGEIGIGQIMPVNAGQCGMTAKDLENAELNILCSAILISKKLQNCGYDVRGAITDYNMPAAQCSEGQNPNNPDYVGSIMRFYYMWNQHTANTF